MKAEFNARAADKAGFLDKLARMSAHVEGLKVQRRCHLLKSFRIELLLKCLAIGTTSKPAWQKKASALMQMP